MRKSLQTLSIGWTIPRPPVPAASWHQWEAMPPDSAVEPPDAATEAALSWPPRTIAALRLGFQHRLSRHVGWQLAPTLPPVTSEAFEQAATVYKRGVAHHREDASQAASGSSSGQYNIRIHDDRTLPPTLLKGDDFALVDANVAVSWPDLAALPHVLVLPTNEHSKTLASIAKILAAWDGTRPLAAFGGGILCDMAGFAASLRKAPFRFVPTTLLAMADACVGGKTGVNFQPFGKNQLGAFAFPTVVDVWPGFLATLPPRELKAGGVECLKHASLTRDHRLAAGLTEALRNNDRAALTDLLPAIIAVKADVVAEDPAENGRRATLNFGHTLAHALESLSQTTTTGAATLLHGEAVAIGMVFAIILSRRVSTLSSAEASALLGQLSHAGVVPSATALAQSLGLEDIQNKNLFNDLQPLLALDKKSQSTGPGVTDWILLSQGGSIAHHKRTGFMTPVSASALAAAWEDFLNVYSNFP